MIIVYSIFVIWRAALFMVAELSALFLSPNHQFTGIGFVTWRNAPNLWYWANFDGEHYLSISKFGYRQFEQAFFPGYPALIHGISFLIKDVLLSGFVVSNISAALFVYMCMKLFSLDYPSSFVKKGVALMLAFPSAFFLGSVYTESLFLLLVILSFYFAKKEKFLLASIFSALACFTRLVGVFLVPALLLMWWKRRQKLSLLAITLVPLGLVAVSVLNFYQTKDFLYFIHVQPLFGAHRTGESLVFLPQVIYRYIKIFMTVNPLSYVFFISVQEFLATTFALGVLAIYCKKIDKAWLVYSLGVLLTPTLTGTLSSMPRYILAAFPVFFVFSNFNKSKYLYACLVCLFILLQVVDVAFFVNAYWIS